MQGLQDHIHRAAKYQLCQHRHLFDLFPLLSKCALRLESHLCVEFVEQENVHRSNTISLVEGLWGALPVEALQDLTIVGVAGGAIGLPQAQRSVLSHSLRFVHHVDLHELLRALDLISALLRRGGTHLTHATTRVFLGAASQVL